MPPAQHTCAVNYLLKYFYLANYLAAAICAALVVILLKQAYRKLDPTFVFGIEAICIVIVTWSIILGKQLHREVSGIDRKVWLLIIGAGILTALFPIVGCA